MAEHCLNSEAAPVNPVADPHPEWLAQWRIARAAVNDRSFPDDCENHPLWPVFEDMENRIANTPAHTPAGMAAQLSLIIEEEGFCLSDPIKQTLHKLAEILGLPSENAVIRLSHK